MAIVLKSFTATGAGNKIFVRAGTTLRYSLSGTFVATCRIERSFDGGASWERLAISLTAPVSAATLESNIPILPQDAQYRWFCSAYTSGTVGASLENIPKTLAEYKDPLGTTIMKVTEEGVTLGGSLTGTIDPTFTGDMSVTGSIAASVDVTATGNISGGTVKGGTYEGAAGGAVRLAQGDATGLPALELGASAGEGFQIKVIEETVDLTDAAAKFVALTTPIPAGAVILSAQANIEELVVAGGTTVKVALGLNGGDVDKYGTSSALTQNLKIDTVPDWAVLAAPEQIDVCGVVTNGSTLGDSDFTAGSVRVRIVYIALASLADVEVEE